MNINGDRSDSDLQSDETLPRELGVVGEDLGLALKKVDIAAFDAAAERLREMAGAWFVEGVGRSGLVARMFAMRLMHLGRDVYVVGDTTTPAIREADGYWAISGSGETATLVAHASDAAEIGAEIVAMTSNLHSTLARLADLVVHVPTTKTAQIPGNPSEMTALAITDALFLRLTRSDSRAHARAASLHANLQ